MSYMIIDGKKVEFTDEKNILEVIRKAGIDLPTFCYYSELSIHGACRMCMVEDKRGSVMAACSTLPADGMEVKTNTPKLQKHRKMILELLLASHCRDCTTCAKSGKCRLQEFAYRYGVKQVRFENTQPRKKIDTSSTSIVRDMNKCILCGDCVRVCQEKQGLGVLDFAFRGPKMSISTAFGQDIADVDCVNCGQCAAACPTGAITIKDETAKMWKYINDPTKKVYVQIAPAVRVALGDEFGLEHGTNVFGKIVAALRMMGVDEVYDTTFAADLTVIEESAEFVERLKNGGELPLFTSCCPAWVKYCEDKHPELMKNVSTCRSPMQMFGSVINEHHKMQEDDRECINVAIMPCTAKKYEAARDEFVKDGKRNVDLSLTTQELASMIREAGIMFDKLEGEFTDEPFELGSGAGVIFGVTGGVAEAVLRHCADRQDNETVKALKFVGVRGSEGIKEASMTVGGVELKVCVVHGLKNAEKVIEGIQSGELDYHIIEVMACPEGCIGGAGQPFGMRSERDKRARGLYRADKLAQIKYSSKNHAAINVYDTIIKDRNHELLHVHYKRTEK